MFFLAGFCLAIIASQFQPVLPVAEYMLLALIASLVCLLFRYRIPRFALLWLLLAGLLSGWVYSSVFAAKRLQQELDARWQQQDIALLVRISSTPVRHPHYWRTLVSVSPPTAYKLHTIQLNWYAPYQPQACEWWQVTVRLKRPNGLRNPGSWNYRSYLLAQGIQATGYVRAATRVRSDENCLHGFRSRWHDYVQTQLPTAAAAWLIALSTGDKSLLDSQQQQLMQSAGINHLFVISGLHIGMAASVMYGLVLLVRRLGGGLLWPRDWRAAAAASGLLAAVAYAALAGFTIPAQRALIMLTVFFGTQLVGVHLPVWLRFWLAMALVLLVNPLAAMGAGFALSFAAVALLIMVIQALQAWPPSWRRKAGGMIASQFYIALGLSPLLLLFFQQLPAGGPWINLLAIPVVSFMLVPLVLLALLLWTLTGNDYGLLPLAAYLLEGLLDLLVWLDDRFQTLLSSSASFRSDPAALGIWAFIVLLLLLPRYWPGRYSAAGLLAVALWLMPVPDKLVPGELAVHVLDVGQGVSVLIRTAEHTLLYDTGAAWESGSMAEQVVLPVLRQFAIRQLDTVIISHFDNDHAGGWPFIDKTLPVQQWFGHAQTAPFTACVAGQSWYWDGIRFDMLHPVDGTPLSQRNDASCVLLIRAAGRSVLLPGDLGRKAEVQMLNRLQALSPAMPLDVLLAPHHGSKGSSSQALLDTLNRRDPPVVIFSSGYLNRYRHPHPLVLSRYRQIPAHLFNTAVHGMVSVYIRADGSVKASSFRQQARRYWDDHLEY